MHEIKTYGNFYPQEMFDEFVNQYRDVPMNYGWKGGWRTDPHGHWNYSFFKAGSANLADCSDKVSGVIKDMMLHVKNHEYFEGEDLALLRCYINGHTYGVDGYFHQDSPRDDEFTTVLYMNEKWSPNWAGETVFLSPDKKNVLLRSVLPTPNRVVIFPSKIMHAARAVSRICTDLRQTFMFKFRKKRSANFEKLSTFLIQNGATLYKHKYGSLHDHLVRVYQILETANFSEDICFAGGIHSVFGTNAYTKQLFNEQHKELLIENFGVRAVELSNLFSSINRPKYLENPISIDDNKIVVLLNDDSELTLDNETYKSLLAIECANLIDQDSLKDNKPNLQAFWGQNVEKNK